MTGKLAHAGPQPGGLPLSSKALFAGLLAALVNLAWLIATYTSPAFCLGGALLWNAGLAGFLAHRWHGKCRELGLLTEVLTAIGHGRFSSEQTALFAADPKITEVVRELSGRLQQRVEDLREAAHFDALTSLCNRLHFQQRIGPLLNSAEMQNLSAALLFVDLDGFKAINDNHGHVIGDGLLRIAADRLRLATRLDPDPDLGNATSLLARLGGDEFVFFVLHEDSARLATKIASRIIRVLGEPFEIGPHTVSVSASIGIAKFPQDASDLTSLLRLADTAMYHAKRSGKGRYEIYDPALDEEARELAVIEQELREAVTRGSLELYYQPLLDLHGAKVPCAEALIRWPHPSRGLQIPRQFMPLAARAGLIPALGDWVINEAVMHIAEFQRAGTPVQISINISPLHLEQVNFIATIRAALQRWQVAPHLLQIEVTEEVALRDAELAADRLRQLSDLGVTIAIDDFGTGYSNLSLLTKLPISRLKIDKSLLKDLTIRPDARVLVQTIISMGNSLGLHTIAEGVETETELELLSAMGCDAAQGFLIARPFDLPHLRAWVATGNAQNARLTNAA